MKLRYWRWLSVILSVGGAVASVIIFFFCRSWSGLVGSAVSALGLAILWRVYLAEEASNDLQRKLDKEIQTR